jgi:hypothetical protein
MKRFPSMCVLGVCTLLGSPQFTEAQVARFRYLASVYADSKGVGLNRPEGIACGANGQVVVGDTGNDRLLRFAFRDKAFTDGSEFKNPEVTAPSRVQVNPKGQVFALDNIQHRIAYLSPEGEFKGVLKFEGVPVPTTVVPKSFAIDTDGNIYVLDAFAGRVLVLNAETQFQKALPLPGEAGFISDLTVDSGGTVFLIDATRRRIFSAAKDATAFTAVGKDLSDVIATMPTYVTTRNGTIFVSEGNGSRIIGLGRDGTFLTRQLTMGWTEGSLNHPSQICVNDKDELFVADRDNSRVQVFQLMR